MSLEWKPESIYTALIADHFIGEIPYDTHVDHFKEVVKPTTHLRDIVHKEVPFSISFGKSSELRYVIGYE
jgi:hypothetical protein